MKFYDISAHPTVKCDHCGIDETIQQYLMDCPKSNIFINIKITIQQALEEASISRQQQQETYERLLSYFLSTTFCNAINAADYWCNSRGKFQMAFGPDGTWTKILRFGHGSTT